MLIEYDMPSDTLTIRWNKDHEKSIWRMARSNVDLLVDYGNETSAVRIYRASNYCPDLDGALVSWQTEINVAGHSQRTRKHFDPPLPWDDLAPAPILNHATKNQTQRGICCRCGALAQHRRAPCKRDGWPLHNLCTRCWLHPIKNIDPYKLPEENLCQTNARAAERPSVITEYSSRKDPTPDRWMSPLSSSSARTAGR